MIDRPLPFFPGEPLLLLLDGDLVSAAIFSFSVSNPIAAVSSSLTHAEPTTITGFTVKD